MKDCTLLIEQARTAFENDCTKDFKLVKFEKVGGYVPTGSDLIDFEIRADFIMLACAILQKTVEVLPYFTFVSPGFGRVLHRIWANQPVQATDIYDPPDPVLEEEKYSFKYKGMRFPVLLGDEIERGHERRIWEPATEPSIYSLPRGHFQISAKLG